MSYVTDSLGWSERVRMENGAQNSDQLCHVTVKAQVSQLVMAHYLPLQRWRRISTWSDKLALLMSIEIHRLSPRSPQKTYRPVLIRCGKGRKKQQDDSNVLSNFGGQVQLMDHELGRSNPNQMSHYRDAMLRSQQNFRIIPQVSNQSLSPFKLQRQQIQNQPETQRYFQNQSPKHASNNQGNYFKTINQDQRPQIQTQYYQFEYDGIKSRQRPMSSTNKQAYIKKGSLNKQNIQRKLNFANQQTNQTNQQQTKVAQIQQMQREQRFNEDVQNGVFKNFKNVTRNAQHQTGGDGHVNQEPDTQSMISLKQFRINRVQSAVSSNRGRNYNQAVDSRFLRNSSQIFSQKDQQLKDSYSKNELNHNNLNALAQSQEIQDLLKQKIIEKVQNLDPVELENLKETLRIEEDLETLQLIENESAQNQEQQQNYDLSPKSKGVPHFNKGKDYNFQTSRGGDADDGASVYSKATRSSLRTLGNKSSRSYASQLEHRLDKERLARLKLQQEVEELKKISSALSTQIGWNKSSSAQQSLMFQTKSQRN